MGQKLLYPIIDGKKQCGVCGEWLELNNFTKSKGKYYSSKCKKCANEYSKKYREKNKEKIAKRQKEYMESLSFRHKKNEYNKIYRKNEYVKKKNLEANRKWKMEEKKKAVEYKGGSCIKCGYNKCLTALEFHHVIPEEKDNYNSHWTFERNKNELDKCILVCANCHREIHAKEIWYE